MTVESLIAYALALGLFAASPGPGVFATIGHAITRGSGPAFALLSGLIVGDIVFLVGAALGLGVAAKQLGELFLLVRIAGAAYLIWLGWKSWTKTHAASMREPSQPNAKSFLGGVAISLSNPKVMVFYLAFLPTFVDLTQLNSGGILVLALITAIVSYMVLGFYIVGARRLSRSLAKPTVRRAFDRAAGSMLIAAGVLVATRN